MAVLPETEILGERVEGRGVPPSEVAVLLVEEDRLEGAVAGRGAPLLEVVVLLEEVDKGQVTEAEVADVDQ